MASSWLILETLMEVVEEQLRDGCGHIRGSGLLSIVTCKTGITIRYFGNVTNYSYSCFEKGCPTIPYATMPKGILGNRGSWSLIEV